MIAQVAQGHASRLLSSMTQHRIDIGVNLIHNLVDRSFVAQLGNGILHLLQAQLTTLNVLLRHYSDVRQVSTMTRQQTNTLAARIQHLQGFHVLTQVAVGLRDHSGVATSDGVTGNDAFNIVLAITSVNEVADGISGVTRGCHDLNLRGYSVEDDAFAVDKRILTSRAVLRLQLTNRRAGELAETCGAISMVAMTVRQQNQRNVAGITLEDVQVSLVLRTRIDDNTAAIPLSLNNVGVRTLQRRVAGVRAQNDAHRLRNLTQLAIRRMLHVLYPTWLRNPGSVPRPPIRLIWVYARFTTARRTQHPRCSRRQKKQLLGYFNDDLDFHGSVQRKLIHTHCRTSVLAPFAEDVAEEFRGPIDNARLTSKSSGGIDEADNLHDAGDIVEANLGIDCGQSVESAGAGGLLGLLSSDFCTDVADVGELAVHKGELTGSENKVARARRGYVSRNCRGNCRQGKPQVLKSLGRSARFRVAHLS